MAEDDRAGATPAGDARGPADPAFQPIYRADVEPGWLDYNGHLNEA